MIISNEEKLIPELADVIKLFGEADDFDLVHSVTERDGAFVNEVKISTSDGGINEVFTDVYPKTNGQTEKKRYLKRYAKLAVYRTLVKLTGKNMPWGALTGIRPTKLAYQQREKTGEFADFFTSVMRVSDRKTELVKKILLSQEGIYGREGNRTDFFAGIPFCPTRCRYCSFISSDIRATYKLIPAYVDALTEEIASAKELVKDLKSVYIGGGTPVALPTDALKKVLTAIGYKGVEYTVEAG
ncbi:MAG: hypothetical protein MJ072_06780, partial [Clostridia bacterium]|nr:hypothetical protein [Clostridia bacterium]